MLRIVPPTVPRVGRSDEHFPDGFELHLLPNTDRVCSRVGHAPPFYPLAGLFQGAAEQPRGGVSCTVTASLGVHAWGPTREERDDVRDWWEVRGGLFYRVVM